MYLPAAECVEDDKNYSYSVKLLFKLPPLCLTRNKKSWVKANIEFAPRNLDYLFPFYPQDKQQESRLGLQKYVLKAGRLVLVVTNDQLNRTNAQLHYANV